MRKVGVSDALKELSMEPIQQHIKRCWKCRGPLIQRMIDLPTKVSIRQFMCLSCRRPSPAGVKLR